MCQYTCVCVIDIKCLWIEHAHILALLLILSLSRFMVVADLRQVYAHVFSLTAQANLMVRGFFMAV